MSWWRAFGVAAVMVGFVAGVSGCSAGQAPTAFSGPYGPKVKAAYEAATDPAVKATLADGKITQAEYDAAVQRMVKCAADQGVTVMPQQQPGGLYPYMLIKTGNADAVFTSCEDATLTPIELLSAGFNNPQNRDMNDVYADCLKRAGVVPRDYTGQQFQADSKANSGPFSNEVRRLLDPGSRSAAVHDRPAVQRYAGEFWGGWVAPGVEGFVGHRCGGGRGGGGCRGCGGPCGGFGAHSAGSGCGECAHSSGRAGVVRRRPAGDGGADSGGAATVAAGRGGTLTASSCRPGSSVASGTARGRSTGRRSSRSRPVNRCTGTWVSGRTGPMWRRCSVSWCAWAVTSRWTAGTGPRRAGRSRRSGGERADQGHGSGVGGRGVVASPSATMTTCAPLGSRSPPATPWGRSGRAWWPHACLRCPQTWWPGPGP